MNNQIVIKRQVFDDLKRKETMLLNLFELINCYGGYYHIDHGTEQAYMRAREQIAKWRLLEVTGGFGQSC